MQPQGQPLSYGIAVAARRVELDTRHTARGCLVLKCTAKAAERAEGLRANPTTCSTVALLVGRVGRFALHTGVEVGRQRLDRRIAGELRVTCFRPATHAMLSDDQWRGAGVVQPLVQSACSQGSHPQGISSEREFAFDFVAKSI